MKTLSRKKQHALLTIGFCTLFWCSFAEVALTQQMTGGKAIALKSNVIKVQVNDEHGFGFIIAEDSGNLYSVTALHVVQSNVTDPSSAVSSPDINVTFYSDQGLRYKAILLKGSTSHDLALIRVKTPPGLRWQRRSLAATSEEKRGTPIWFIGQDEEWRAPAVNGAVNSDGTNADGWLDFSLYGLTPGCSGGPLVTDTGIIGMIKGENRALSIDFISRQIRDWGYPWHLTVGAPSNTPMGNGSAPVSSALTEPPDLSSNLETMEARVAAAGQYWDEKKRQLAGMGRTLRSDILTELGAARAGATRCRQSASAKQWQDAQSCVDRVSQHLDSLDSFK